MPSRRAPSNAAQQEPANVPQSDAPSLHFNNILFPAWYEAAWGQEDAKIASSGSDIDRARVFLLRMAMLNPDPLIVKEIRAIITKAEYGTVIALAGAVQIRIFGDRHSSFATNPLMQVVRFLLIKSRVPEGTVSEEARSVLDYFWDPTIQRNLDPLPSGPTVTYKYPSGRLRVAIVGGGPTALSSAIALAEKGQGAVEVHTWERRWVWKRRPDGSSYADYPSTAKRRDQVVTLQDSVTSLLTPASYKALFAGRPERVWPGSANIQIRKVEDRFLERVQQPEFKGLIHLHCEGMTREKIEDMGDFHVLLGADGAASWVRKSYFDDYEVERGRSWALGLAFDRPAGLPWSQSLNVFLTLGQTRYLLNASDHDGRGYLNMQLTDSEWQKMTTIDGQRVHFGRPGCLRKPDGSVPEGFEESQVFAPSEDKDSALWVSISDGLKLFGFKESEVINIVSIPIEVKAVTEAVHALPQNETHALRRPHALVAVAGDAAMTVHFWPGRGLNSGIKAGLALGDELVHALNTGKFIGMPLSALKEYNSFILKLQNREHDKRSIPIITQSGSPEMLGWLLEKANSVPDNVAIEWLVGAMTQIAARLEERKDWAYPPVANVEPQLRIILRQLSSVTLREMAVSFPWPTREMAGAEVLPIRSMKPQEKQKWLQSIWSKLQDEATSRTKSSTRPPLIANGTDKPVSASRFEAPRNPSPRPPSSAGLGRSNATQSVRVSSRNLELPIRGCGVDGAENARDRSPSPSGELSIGRMLTVHRKPPANMMGDALSLALFRVQEVA